MPSKRLRKAERRFRRALKEMMRARKRAAKAERAYGRALYDERHLPRSVRTDKKQGDRITDADEAAIREGT